MTIDPSPPEAHAVTRAEARADTRLIRSLVVGLFIFVGIYALYFAREFFMPVVLAFFLTMTLTPVVRLMKRYGIPEVVSAPLVILGAAALIIGAGYLLSTPVVDLIANAPKIGAQLDDRFQHLRAPVDRFLAVLRELQSATDANEPGVQRVSLQQPGILSQAAGDLLSVGTTFAIVLVLSLLLLASGTLFYEKIVQSFARMSEKKLALRVVYDIEREVSRYLFTIAVINAGLGAVIGLGLWGLGVPDPLVWGVAAALLNFLPYIGPILTIALVGIISIVTFPSLSYALLAPGYVVVCAVIEGQFVTPPIVGRRLEINYVAIFIAIAFWSWLWGFAGALMAVPILVVIKVFCDNFESLRHVGNFLGAQQTPVTPDESANGTNGSAAS
ncbi:MAG: AI-2E family transporter [Rhizobiaceae bacterium]